MPSKLRLACAAAWLAAALLTVALADARAEEPPGPEWRTPAESSAFRSTSSYEETLEFLRRLEVRFPAMSLGYYGVSGQGRRLPVVVVARERLFTAKRLRALPRPIVLVVSATHGGEVDGKEATLMLLRDLALGRHATLLDQVTPVFVPIFNVDGHEQAPRHDGPHPRGTVEGTGSRTTSHGLDLGVDHLKLASEEARSLAALFNQWRPHLVIDQRTSHGFGDDLDVAYVHAGAPRLPAPLEAWLRPRMESVVRALAGAGHRTGPHAEPAGAIRHPDAARPPADVRDATGYFALRNRPAVRVDTHAGKPFRERVLANRAFLEAILTEAGREGASLRRAVEEAEKATMDAGAPSAPPSEIALGPGSGAAVPRPRGYLVLPGWPQIEERLRWHGLRFERVEKPAEAEVEVTRLSEPRFADRPDQGLTRVTSVRVERRVERHRIAAGTLWVPADQPDFAVAAHLLEPASPDSLLSWGLLSAVFEIERGARELEGVLPAFRVTRPAALATRRAH